MAKNAVDTVASAVLAHLLAGTAGLHSGASRQSKSSRAASRAPAAALDENALAAWLTDAIADAIASDGATAGEDDIEGLISSLTEADIEAIAARLADELEPLLDRSELPADKIEI